MATWATGSLNRTETMEDWLGGIARALTFCGGVQHLIVSMVEPHLPAT
jgi:hypothetical protein